MFGIASYGIGFFLCTLALQTLLHQIRKNGNKGASSVWTGTNAIIIICIVGLITESTYFFAAVLGFVVADEIGLAAGWH